MRKTWVIVADSARAGVTNFGSLVSLAGTRVRCAAVDLDGELAGSNDFEFIDGGGNSCGCPAATGSCKVVSAGLAPPDALPSAN